MPKIPKQTSGIKLEAMCDAIRRKVGCSHSENAGTNRFNKMELHSVLAKMILLEQQVAEQQTLRELVRTVLEEMKAQLSEKAAG